MYYSFEHSDGVEISRCEYRAPVFESGVAPFMFGLTGFETKSSLSFNTWQSSPDLEEYQSLQDTDESSFLVQRRLTDRAVWALVALCEKKDPYTAWHQLRVAELAYAVGKEIGMDEKQLDGMCVMGLVHDIGKVILPSEILNKSDKLTAEEFSLIRSHPKVGYDVLKNLEFPWPVAEVVLQHHERLDGSGYPEGLRTNDILMEAKILAVVDVFESMTSRRPYRPACGLEHTLEELVRNSGVLYDPAAVEAICLLGKRQISYFNP